MFSSEPNTIKSIHQTRNRHRGLSYFKLVVAINNIESHKQSQIWFNLETIDHGRQFLVKKGKPKSEARDREREQN